MTTAKKTKPDIQYGNVEIPKSAFEPKNVKERITIFVDEDVLDKFRSEAERIGIGYQTLINRILRAAAFPEAGGVMPMSDVELQRIVRALKPALIEELKKEMSQLATRARPPKKKQA